MGSSPSREQVAEEVENVERMEGEGGHPYSSEGDLGPMTDPLEYGDKPGITTPRTRIPEEGWDDDSAEFGQEKEIVTPEPLVSTAAGCNCSCPGHCPEDCVPSCQCAGHTRNKPGYNVSGDEP
jgi:hypothetical protein